MDKRYKIEYGILSAYMIIMILIPVFTSPINASFIDTGEIVVTHDDIFSGEDNSIFVGSEVPLSSIDIYIDEDLVDYGVYDINETESYLPTNICMKKGAQEGDIQNLETTDGEGILYDPHCKYVEAYIHFSSNYIGHLESGSLSMHFNSTDEYDIDLYYYDFITHNWIKIIDEKVDNPYYTFSDNFTLDASLFDFPTVWLKLKLRCDGYQNVLMDKMVISDPVIPEFEGDEFTIDVSSYDDGYYILKLVITDDQFNAHDYETVICIDNSPPIFNMINFPENNSVHNNTDILFFEAEIDELVIECSFLSFTLNGSEYYTLFLGNNSIFSYKNTFLPGNYSYILATADRAGHVSYAFGNFTVVRFEQSAEYLGDNCTECEESGDSEAVDNADEMITTLLVRIPESASSPGYNVEVYFDTKVEDIELTYEVLTKGDEVVIDSGKIINGTTSKLYLDIYNEDLIIQIHYGDNLIFESEFSVKNIEVLANGFDWNFVFALIALVGLLISIAGLLYSVSRDSRRDKVYKEGDNGRIPV